MFIIFWEYLGTISEVSFNSAGNNLLMESIKNFENDWENSWYSFWCHGVFLMISIFYKPCSEGHLQGVPHLYLGLGEYIHVYFKYICIYGAKPFFWVQDTNWWPETEWFVIITIFLIISIFNNFYGHVQNLLPLMVTYHPMIYLLWRWRLFSL